MIYVIYHNDFDGWCARIILERFYGKLEAFPTSFKKRHALHTRSSSRGNTFHKIKELKEKIILIDNHMYPRELKEKFKKSKIIFVH
jgi:oligoribonuclease NrnB/cAMP/cGMP phosphodiesterase (DHH superfamily)